jgi:Fe-S-cluster containining protein
LKNDLVTRNVPCNGCTLCCESDAIRLLPEDDDAHYKTESHPRIPGALMLAHKAGGECFYLCDGGCSIHGQAPSLCRSADCRSVAIRLDLEYAMELHEAGKLDIRVWDRGRQLLEGMAFKIRGDVEERAER